MFGRVYVRGTCGYSTTNEKTKHGGGSCRVFFFCWVGLACNTHVSAHALVMVTTKRMEEKRNELERVGCQLQLSTSSRPFHPMNSQFSMNNDHSLSCPVLSRPVPFPFRLGGGHQYWCVYVCVIFDCVRFVVRGASSLQFNTYGTHTECSLEKMRLRRCAR